MALGLLPAGDGDGGFGVMEITRPAGAAAEPVIELLEVAPEAAFLVAGPMRLPVQTDRNGEVVIGGDDRPALMTALRAVREAQLVDRGGKIVGRLSLAGAAAALLYIDEAQHRIGSVTALVRPGPLPASTVLPPPRLPEVTSTAGSSKPPAMFGARVAARLRGDDACKSDAGRTDDPPTFARLDATHTLAWVPTSCESGAYNLLGTAYVVTDGRRGDPEPAEFGAFPGDVHDGDDTSGANVSWDPKTRVLHTGMLGRGLGDCGLWHDYVWDGRRFQAVERREMGECRGGMDAITTWRARVCR